VSYGTIYTTKPLRRGTDIDRTTPWRALADLKIADAMRPFRPPLPVPPPAQASSAPVGADGASMAPDGAALPGPVIYQADPQALFAGSVAQALRQLAVYGHDGLPVLAADGRQIPGWVTAPDVLRAIARQLSTRPGPDPAGPGRRRLGPHRPGHTPGAPADPAARLPVHRDHHHRRLPAAGRTLADVTWPPGATPVIVLRGHHLRPPHPALTLAPGDRVSLLTAAPADSPERDSGGGHHARPASDGTSNHA
jgi:chloride channel protein, CIC family